MQKIEQALEHTNLSVLEAELNMNQRAGQPQAVEVLSITLGNLMYAYGHIGDRECNTIAVTADLCGRCGFF